MAENSPPQRGTLLRRAHELLESVGQPVAEETLIQHLFGANNNAGQQGFWTVMLRQALRSSALFEEAGAIGIASDVRWSLSAWRSTLQQLSDVEFVVIDTETTGLRPGPDRVIEVACVRVRGGEAIDSFQTLINPIRRIPPFIAQFTGITQEMVNDAPTAKEIMPDVMHFIDGAIVVGHNVGFDIGFLSYEAQLVGRAFPPDGLDTIPLARRFCPGLKRFKLDMVASHLNIPTVNRHRALGDATVTAAIFLRILEFARQQNISTLGQLRRRLQLPVAWSGDITQTASAEKGEKWRADGKLASSSLPTTRPTGSIFLNPAWKREFSTKPGVYLMKDENEQVIYVGKAKNLKIGLRHTTVTPLAIRARWTDSYRASKRSKRLRWDQNLRHCYANRK